MCSQLKKFQHFVLFYQEPESAPDKKFPEQPQNRPAPKPWSYCSMFATKPTLHPVAIIPPPSTHRLPADTQGKHAPFRIQFNMIILLCHRTYCSYLADLENLAVLADCNT